MNLRFKILLILITTFMSFNVISQVDILGIHYYMEEPNIPYLEADTLNYYAIFEYHFDNDSVLVFNDSCILYQGNLALATLYSKKVKLGKVSELKDVFVHLNNSPILKLQMIKGKYYIRFTLNRVRGVLGICYSKFPPRYR